MLAAEQNNKNHFKLMLRRFLMKHRGCSTWRSQALGYFRMISEDFFNDVVSTCVAEGTIRLSAGKNGAQILTWHDVGTVEEATRG
jgi:hypothetical protein